LFCLFFLNFFQFFFLFFLFVLFFSLFLFFIFFYKIFFVSYSLIFSFFFLFFMSISNFFPFSCQLFTPQIYREDGETIRLPDGIYEVEFARGPESIVEKRRITVDAPMRSTPSRCAAGSIRQSLAGGREIITSTPRMCALLEADGRGACARHGEALPRRRSEVGANLTWGPCFDYQKQFFTGKEADASQFPYILRYDVEVSGFGSHNSGHLCLLRLREQMYPGGESMAHWPTLGLNTLRWAKKQGAVCWPGAFRCGPAGRFARAAKLPGAALRRHRRQ
jgi:hypothetical protein